MGVTACCLSPSSVTSSHPHRVSPSSHVIESHPHIPPWWTLQRHVQSDDALRKRREADMQRIAEQYKAGLTQHADATRKKTQLATAIPKVRV